MLRALLRRVLPLAFMATGLALAGPVQAQVRGGPPPGLPAGFPASMPAGGPPRGMPPGPPAGLPVRPDVPAHGPPPWSGNAAAHDAPGLARASEATSDKLSKVQRDRAAERAKESPGTYELDRNGALAIRGEVMVTGLGPLDLARLEKHGFSILRREDVAGIDMALAVVSHDGMDAARAIDLLRRLAPNGTYALNHVLFESGAAPDGGSGEAAARWPARDAGAAVGLIDSGVAPVVDDSPRVRLLRRNFAQGPSRPAQHGTAVAAILARAPGRVTIHAADIFGSDPRGGTSELLVRALGWMASERVPVVNVSMVGPANQIVGAVIAKLIAAGFTIVAPVGNDGRAARLLYPASYPGVIAVSAAGQSGRLLPEASRVRRVDFVAPGVASVPDATGHRVEVRGTSFAAPIVSRLIAEGVHSPDPAAARRRLDQLAANAQRPKTDRIWYGRGIVGMNTPAD